MMELRPWAIMALVSVAGGARRVEPVAIGLSHVPIAVSNLDAATRDFVSLGFAMKEGRPHGYIFLAPLNQSPTDRPEHFAHRNSASRLTSVTLESASFGQERRVFDALGLREEPCPAHLAPHLSGTAAAKDAIAVTCVPLADGSWLRLLQSPGRARTRITGLGVQVGSLSTLAGVLTESHVAFVRLDKPLPLVVVDGNLTHGIRLEFSSGGPHQ
jgi:catechol 2,3-dioxygenase-like lactoylglutathione lyase family enzyme